MKMIGFGGRALGIGLATALLAGCGIAQVGPSDAMSPAIMRTGGHSQALPGKSQDLIYATDGCGGICVLSYPEGKLVASISDPNVTGGDCSDTNGNVFVASDNQILEFAHGGTSPIATLTLPGNHASGCGIDSVTGNLAVVFSGSGENVAVFPNASGSPTLYETFIGSNYCGYDSSGNLYVSGTDGQTNAIAQLPVGSSSFRLLSIDQTLGVPGQIQWDGMHITYESLTQRKINILRLHISGSVATVVGHTRLKGAVNAHQTWIAGDSVIVPYSAQGFNTNKIGLWAYPKSGKATAKFGNFGQGGSAQFFGVTLSKG
jgi:hypothetical protein